jgi:hypothetical protein
MNFSIAPPKQRTGGTIAQTYMLDAIYKKVVLGWASIGRVALLR